MLTKLTEDEVALCFAYTVQEVRLIVEKLGMMVEYQGAKRSMSVSRLWSLRQTLGQELSLWSDVAGVEPSSQSFNTTELGLQVVKLHDYRLAAIWSLRLNVVFPGDALSTKSQHRTGNLVSKVSNQCVRLTESQISMIRI
ncbi:hypothetical protein RF663_09310 [Aeromonas veronii]|uniref:hypothetical protein n=1 Tax=Aeromonas veronii TaxID=654 RepID=UPI002853124B|nr:hypothetical protein [Aeromonas veronii]MDR5014422.1 hypothetical protein [Aeromonas veronii]